jgi:hypothetical protein
MGQGGFVNRAVVVSKGAPCPARSTIGAALVLDFSLSAPEIGEVVVARPHQRHVVRLAVAYPIVRRVAEGFYAAQKNL